MAQRPHHSLLLLPRTSTPILGLAAACVCLQRAFLHPLPCFPTCSHFQQRPDDLIPLCFYHPRTSVPILGLTAVCAPLQHAFWFHARYPASVPAAGSSSSPAAPLSSLYITPAPPLQLLTLAATHARPLTPSHLVTSVTPALVLFPPDDSTSRPPKPRSIIPNSEANEDGYSTGVWVLSVVSERFNSAHSGGDNLNVKTIGSPLSNHPAPTPTIACVETPAQHIRDHIGNILFLVRHPPQRNALASDFRAHGAVKATCRIVLRPLHTRPGTVQLWRYRDRESGSERCYLRDVLSLSRLRPAAVPPPPFGSILRDAHSVYQRACSIPRADRRNNVIALVLRLRWTRVLRGLDSAPFPHTRYPGRATPNHAQIVRKSLRKQTTVGAHDLRKGARVALLAGAIAKAGGARSLAEAAPRASATPNLAQIVCESPWRQDRRRSRLSLPPNICRICTDA
ncbi:hypothetical protein B0H19DRAFT_1262743 [Mycena capillaripes]|nr:hypothetical protein B0H19DRAFT_1262743 [Mycena capillaripes]